MQTTQNTKSSIEYPWTNTSAILDSWAFPALSLSHRSSFFNWMISIHAGIGMHGNYSKNEECTQVEYDFFQNAPRYSQWRERNKEQHFSGSVCALLLKLPRRKLTRKYYEHRTLLFVRLHKISKKKRVRWQWIHQTISSLPDYAQHWSSAATHLFGLKKWVKQFFTIKRRK